MMANVNRIRYGKKILVTGIIRIQAPKLITINMEKVQRPDGCWGI